MNQEVVIDERSDRSNLVRRGRYLEYFTIGYNSLEGLIAIGAGLMLMKRAESALKQSVYE
jgi:hypothetical protein